MRRGLVAVDVDPKFPQAIGIASIIRNTVLFGNFHWEVLHSGFTDSPFFTSDFPIAIEETSDSTVLNKIVPLSPDIAIRIMPDRARKPGSEQVDFRNFSYSSRDLTRKQVGRINQLLVRCAEELVLLRDNHEWVFDFIKRNASFRIETKVSKLLNASGIVCRQEITKCRAVDKPESSEGDLTK